MTQVERTRRYRERHREKVREVGRVAQQKYRANNKEKVLTAGRAARSEQMASMAFRHDKVPTQELFDEMRSSAKIGIFMLPSEGILKWAKTREPLLIDELLLFGVTAALAILRRCRTCSSPAAMKQFLERQTTKEGARMKVRIGQSRQFSRIVEMLDAHLVDGRLLGDCTKGDLLRAAASSEASAGEATMNAQFYRLLAAMLPEHGVTVRQANNRKEVVALLTATFREGPE